MNKIDNSFRALGYVIIGILVFGVIISINVFLCQDRPQDYSEVAR